ncbi:hypothetical protein ACFOJ6_00785 [Gordonia humi]|uniref:hypothetical protein n=1 Tax=Gordonia humi TaxID=686429 RepID=UPI0036207B2D
MNAGGTPVGAAATLRGRRIRGVPLVYPVLLLIVGALGLTLYLTTKSAQDSYALDAMRKENQSLQDKRDNLQRQFDQSDSAAEIGKKAAALDMVPADGAVQIVIGADGKARRVGEAKTSDGKVLPDLNPAPDPVKEIDTDKVDDSEGLGDSGSSQQTSTQAAPSTSTPAPTSDPTSQAPAPSDRPATNVRPADPGRRVSAPRTDVTPPVSATPTPNTRSVR